MGIYEVTVDKGKATLTKKGKTLKVVRPGPAAGEVEKVPNPDAPVEDAKSAKGKDAKD